MITKRPPSQHLAIQGSRRARPRLLVNRLLVNRLLMNRLLGAAMFAGALVTSAVSPFAAMRAASAQERPLATADQHGGPRPAAELDSAANRELPSISAEPSPSGGVDALARALLLDNLPREYENSKHWGQTKPRWDGLKISVDGLQIKTKRRWKDVHHGTWTQYRAWLIEPERDLHIRFDNLRPAGGHRTAFDLTVDARLGASGRVSEWNRGLQLYSFHADAEGNIRLHLTCEVALRLDAARLPPDVVIAPQVTEARVELREFRLHRISNADGPLVRQLGNSLRGDMEREVNERSVKLVEKLNRAIDRNHDRLRLSVRDLATSGWSQLVPYPTPQDR